MSFKTVVLIISSIWALAGTMAEAWQLPVVAEHAEVVPSPESGRFINLMGLFPVGTLVRLSPDEVAVVTHEHPSDPFRPQVKILLDRVGEPAENPSRVNTWEPDGRGDSRCAVVEGVDPDAAGLDPTAVK